MALPCNPLDLAAVCAVFLLRCALFVAKRVNKRTKESVFTVSVCCCCCCFGVVCFFLLPPPPPPFFREVVFGFVCWGFMFACLVWFFVVVVVVCLFYLVCWGLYWLIGWLVCWLLVGFLLFVCLFLSFFLSLLFLLCWREGKIGVSRPAALLTLLVL